MYDRIYSILTINPGSTSTKLAYFENDRMLFSENIAHPAHELDVFPDLESQKPYRKDIILRFLEKHNIDLEYIDAFVGRGGALEALEGGTYYVNDLAYEHARTCYKAVHPSVLGLQIARDLADLHDKPSFFVNAPSTDEFMDIARVSGMKEIQRLSSIHALNQKEVGIRYASSIGRNYEDLNLVVGHLGGGISISAHRHGRIIDSNDCLGSSGTFAPTRSGSVPDLGLIHLCFSGRYSEKELCEKVTKTGGLMDYLGTADLREAHEMAENGNDYAQLILDAMFLQINKDIGAMCAVLRFDVDAILLTGGCSRDKALEASVRRTCSRIAPVIVYPGEFEMEAMAAGAIRVLTGQEKAKTYTGVSPVNQEWFRDVIY